MFWHPHGISTHASASCLDSHAICSSTCILTSICTCVHNRCNNTFFNTHWEVSLFMEYLTQGWKLFVIPRISCSPFLCTLGRSCFAYRTKVLYCYNRDQQTSLTARLQFTHLHANARRCTKCVLYCLLKIIKYHYSLYI